MFEFLRIGRSSEGIIYYASPKGRNPPTPFKLVESGPNRVVFENPEHDFPSRIIYELGEAGRLMGRVEGTQNGQTAGHTWYWERARLRN